MKDIILFGIQCAGKGTQAALLSERFGYLATNTGQMLRDHVKRDTPLGKRIRPLLDAGEFLPSDMIHEAFDGYFDGLSPERAIIFDGMRTPAGKNIWEKFISDNHRDFVAVMLEVSDGEAIRRTTERGKDEARSDDRDEGIMRSRMRNFWEITQPLVDAYEQIGKLIRINGEQSVEEVQKDLVKALREAKAL